MTSSLKTAGLAGLLVAALATAVPALHAGQSDNTVREGQPVLTQLSAGASALKY